MKGKNELFSNFKYYQYPIRGSGEASYKLDSGRYLKLKDMSYVPKLKSNILSISTLDSKGIIYSFVDSQVLMWKKGKTIDDATIM